MAIAAHTLDLLEVGKTNRYYSDEEREVLQQGRASVEDALSRLHEEKAAIERREKVLKSDIERYNIALAPIKRLPHDVLHYIFTSYCQSAQPIRFPYGMIPTFPQVTLSHVCSTWRQIMLSTPVFWNNVILDVHWSIHTETLVGRVSEWLSRAGNMPCSADFSFSPHQEPVSFRDHRDKAWYKDMVKKVLSLQKFKKLSITSTEDYLREFAELPNENLSCVEELHLYYRDIKAITNADPLEPSLDFSKLSRLVSFSVEPYSISIPNFVAAPRFCGIPWHQLHHIKLGVPISMLFCLRVLELSSPVLETCSIIIHEDRSFLTAPPATVKLICCNQLRSFSVDIHRPGPKAERVVDPFLSLLRMPNLKSLTLGTPEMTHMPVGLQTIINMKELSGMHLEELVIADTTNTINVRALLACMPSLRRVELPTTIEFQEEAMDELGAGSIGPNIEDLTIRACDLEFERLFQMVEARCAVQREGGPQQLEASPFKRVSLSCDDQDLEYSYSRRMDELRDTGVLIDVDFPDEEDSDDYDEDIYGHDDYYDGDWYFYL